MSEAWEASRASIRRLKLALYEADEDTRYKFSLWVAGFALMVTAIVLQFGWPGALFCVGLVVWKAGNA